jgi:hypothetical protein
LLPLLLSYLSERAGPILTALLFPLLPLVLSHSDVLTEHVLVQGREIGKRSSRSILLL